MFYGYCKQKKNGEIRLARRRLRDPELEARGWRQVEQVDSEYLNSSIGNRTGSATSAANRSGT